MESFYKRLYDDTQINENKCKEIIDKIFNKLKELKKPYHYMVITKDIENEIKEKILIYIEGLGIEYKLTKKQYLSLKNFCSENICFK